MKAQVCVILALAVCVGCSDDRLAPPVTDRQAAAEGGIGVALQEVARDEPPSLDIWAAVLADDVDAVKQHIAAGTNLNGKEPTAGITPLILASIFGKAKTARTLIEAGASLEIDYKEGGTALFNAAFFCHPDIVEALLENGADANGTNKDGLTPLDAVAVGWSPELEAIYRSIFRALNLELDLTRIKATRPVVANILREYTEQSLTSGLPLPDRTAPDKNAS